VPKFTNDWSWRFNALECKGNYSATSNNMKLVHWPLMSGLLHLVQLGRSLPGPSSLYQINRPPINGQCTNHHIAL